MSADAEAVKIASDHLAGTIGDELASDALDFGHDAELLLKFHGIYQQDDRDVRRHRRQQGLDVDVSCMVRASVPGGVIETEQWLALDRVAALTDGRLRLTTRQGVQYHFAAKHDLRALVGGINASLLTTLGACGDVVRNVMACPLPDPERRRVLDPVVADLVARFRPRTTSYWELWVDGEQAVTAERPPQPRPADTAPPALDPVDDVEPVYGAAYLPRKFKIAIAWPGDNCVDVYTHDVGIVPTLSGGATGELTGFVVLAGGGMGMNHQRPDDTRPLLARPVAWVAPGDLGPVVEAIVTAHRDHGDRSDRQRARLKYLVEARGVDWLRSEIGRRTGLELVPADDVPEVRVRTHHGWHETPGSTRTLGLPVPGGRVAGGLRRALRRLVADGLVSQLRVTPRQDLLLVGIEPGREGAVEHLLRSNGVSLAADQSPLRSGAIACVALPTCSKALGEAERVLPDLVDRIEEVLADTGLTGLPIGVNMTGCPNGCARPYNAEVGVVGRSKRTYDVYVGGSSGGDRLARLLRADVPLDDVPETLRPLLELFALERGAEAQSGFGEWTWSRTIDELAALLPPEPSSGRRRVRLAAIGATA